MAPKECRNPNREMWQ